MIEDIFINTNAGSISTARVNSVSDPTGRSFQPLVADDTRTFNIYLVDGSGNYISPTGVKSLRVALGDQGSTPYASTAVFTPVTNGFQVLLPLTSASLQTALDNNSGTISTLFEVETTDFADATRTILQASVNVTGQVIDTTPTDAQVHQEAFIVAVTDEVSDISTGASATTFRIPFNFLLQEFRASVTTAPTGSNIVVDLNVNGSSILSTPLSIDAGEKTSTTASVLPVITTPIISDDSEIAIDIDQVGSTIAGLGLKVCLSGRRSS